MQTGKLMVNSENIFPIIKKWLYHDKDIFAREIISNGSDAITKLKKLADLGETSLSSDEFKIDVIINKEDGTIKFIDNGIGMTEEEIDKYINQIAFSGAKEFMESHANDGAENSIIGHFGLGFYSCFMVSTKVTIDSLSYKEGASAVLWECTGETDYLMSSSDKKDRGTTITLYVNDEGKEFLNINMLRNVISKYCNYMPYTITLFEEGANTSKDENNSEENTNNEKIIINEHQPLWMKDPKECTDEEYIAFYHKNFNDVKNPLFWIHLNMDYPVNLKGVMFFPQFSHDYELNEGEVKLYCNQVFVADNIKEVIPDFLLVLKGAIDCPELPLNVSRSFLQSDEYVKKISSYIIKKVADKLNQFKKEDVTKYQSLWDTLGTFIKYGCLRNDSFYDKVKPNILYKTINNEYMNLEEYTASLNTEEYQKKIFYTSDPSREATFIKMFKDTNQNAVVLNAGIDTHFLAYIEQKDHSVKFERIDSAITDNAVDKDESLAELLTTSAETLKTIFNAIVPSSNSLKFKVENLKSDEIAGMFIMSESSRRMQEMFKIYGGNNPFAAGAEDKSFVLNYKNSLVKYILEKNNAEDEKVSLICKQIYDLAKINSEGLTEEEMFAFVNRSQSIMNKMI